MKKEIGITLIALVVTIVVLLILAGTSIAMLSGENGIITKSQRATLNSRGAEVNETVKLAASDNKIIEKTYENEEKIERDWNNKEKVVEKLKLEGTLTNDEADLLLGKNGMIETDVIEIGDITIDFSILNRKKETSAKQITFLVEPSLDIYTNEEVKVTAITESTEYTIETSIDGENWTNSNEQIYTENGTAYARLTDGTKQIGDIKEIDITNIDKVVTKVGSIKCINNETGTEIMADENGYFYYSNAARIVDKNITVELVNGEDSQSGHKSTTYTIEWVDGGETGIAFENETSTVTLGNMGYSSGARTILVYEGYNVIVTTEDNLGNKQTATFYIRF